MDTGGAPCPLPQPGVTKPLRKPCFGKNATCEGAEKVASEDLRPLHCCQATSFEGSRPPMATPTHAATHANVTATLNGCDGGSGMARMQPHISTVKDGNLLML